MKSFNQKLQDCNVNVLNILYVSDEVHGYCSEDILCDLTGLMEMFGTNDELVREYLMLLNLRDICIL